MITDLSITRPKSVNLLNNKNNKQMNLIVHGQGVFLFKNNENMRQISQIELFSLSLSLSFSF